MSHYCLIQHLIPDMHLLNPNLFLLIEVETEHISGSKAKIVKIFADLPLTFPRNYMPASAFKENHSATFHSSSFLLAESKLTPILYSFLPSAANGSA